MPFFSDPEEIRDLISDYSQMSRLWIDTEVADFDTKFPRLSLIQVLHTPEDIQGDRASAIDVLDRPELVEEFIDLIMVNPTIEKVFHHANYDLRFLGKDRAQNVICTLELAKTIPYYLLPISNYKLNTLAQYLCQLPPIDKKYQTSNWGRRPLSKDQINYAILDVVYLAQVDRRLTELRSSMKIDPNVEDIDLLTRRYLSLEHQWKLLDTEINHLKERLKQAMSAQNVVETDYLKLSSYHRTTKKVAIAPLAELIHTTGIELDLKVNITKNIQAELGDLLDRLPIEEEITAIVQLKHKHLED